MWKWYNTHAVIGHAEGERKAILDKLLAIVGELPGVRMEGVEKCLLVNAPAVFLNITPRVKDVQVSFILGREVEAFAIVSSLHLSTKRTAYKVIVGSAEEVDPQLEGWIRAAFALATSQEQGKARASGRKRS